MDDEHCHNCWRAIRDWETPFVFRDHVVCGDCYGLLTRVDAALPRHWHNAPTDRDWHGLMVCDDCFHNWHSRKLDPPKRCPKCRGVLVRPLNFVT